MSPVSSYYTQGALAEALRPGGTVYIHPYVLIKLRDDPRMIETAHPDDRRRILQSWRASKLATLTTEDIEAHLDLIGVLYDRAQFLEGTKPGESAWEISKGWGKHLIALREGEKDFLGLAACELWRRFCPERPSVEMADDWLCEGYWFSHERKPAEAVAAWWKVWEALRPRLAPDMNNLDEAGERLFRGMSQCLSNWSTDLRMEAANASRLEARCGEIGIQFIRELLEALPGENEDLNWQGDLAMILFHLGRDAEAEQCCLQLINAHPNRAIGYISLSDGLTRAFRHMPPDTARIQRAIKVLEQALAYPVEDADGFDVPARLAGARELLSKTASP